MLRTLTAALFLLVPLTVDAGPDFPVVVEVEVDWDHLDDLFYFPLTLEGSRDVFIEDEFRGTWDWDRRLKVLTLDLDDGDLEYVASVDGRCLVGEMWNHDAGYHGTWQACR